MNLPRLLAISASAALLAPAASASANHLDGGAGYPGQQPPQGGGWIAPWNPDQGDAPETPQDWSQPQQQPVQPQQPTRSPQWNVEPLPLVEGSTVGGNVAKLRTNGQAAIPRGAPARVRAIIRAANLIIGKPYKWGGGHGRLADSGYDCSGSVSYALIRASQLAYPMVSGSFARWGASGKGSYVTIYANRGHVYMEVAGLRLDTSAVGDYRGKSGVRWRPLIGKRVGFAVRHIAGL
jgi:cell wall-associated NlpC family hydrolase